MEIKAVIVDEMPSNCGNCKFLYVGHSKGFYGCNLNIKQVDIQVRPDWCPLELESEDK